jgi:uncharacterized protein CbrC (UPF0167 family)
MRFRRRQHEAGSNEPPAVLPTDPPFDTPFPQFAYHPDPRGTGFVAESTARCQACGASRGYIYTGPVYAAEELDEAFCPWCIADGSAAARFDAELTDVGWGVPDGVPREVPEQIARRTPGFSGWQQEHWLYHCGDGAAFLGLAGHKELEPHPDAIDVLRHEHDEHGWSPEEVDEYLAALDKDGQPTAYLFRCRHCGQHLAYSDSS